jgi:putative transposase
MIGLSNTRFHNIKRAVTERQERESIIPEEEIMEAIIQILGNPSLGAMKGCLQLIEARKSIISPQFYHELKKIIEDALRVEVQKRDDENDVLKNQKDRCKPPAEKYEHQRPTQVHDIWSTDFTEISVLGMTFIICVIYENYSQAYLAVKVALVADADLAKKTFLEAVKFAGTTPSQFLLSDNGSQFIGSEFTGALEQINVIHKLTPPGQPWYNGGLESGNQVIKDIILVLLAFTFADDPSLSRGNQSEEEVMASLEQACLQAQQKINEVIPRVQHKTTPQAVLQGEVKKRICDNDNYVSSQKQLRKKRMDAIKKGSKSSTKKTFMAKASAAIKKLLKPMSTERVYTAWRLIQRDFSIVTD